MKKKIKDIVALIPVKGSSERVKRKNLRKFANSSLFELKLNQLKKTTCFSKIIVSSESEEILKIAQRKGFDVHHRDPYYSTSKVPMSEVYSYIASEIDGENIAWINVTNPLANKLVYEKAVRVYSKMPKKFDCLLSAVENKQNYFFKNKRVNFKRSPWSRSQDLIPLISLSFVINILKRENMIKWGSCVGKKPKFFFINPISSIDVDDKYSFKLSETIYKKEFF